LFLLSRTDQAVRRIEQNGILLRRAATLLSRTVVYKTQARAQRALKQPRIAGKQGWRARGKDDARPACSHEVS
jgi:hypothetical protein